MGSYKKVSYVCAHASPESAYLYSNKNRIRFENTPRHIYTVILFLSCFLGSSIDDPQLHPLLATPKNVFITW